MKRDGVRKSSADSRLRMILERMNFAVGLQRVVFYLRDAGSDALARRFGFTDGHHRGARRDAGACDGL